MKNIRYKGILLAILMILMMFVLEKLADENKNDKLFRNIDLTQNIQQQEECILDINNMGVIKYYIEPNIMTIYLRIKVNKDMNEVSFVTNGIQAIISQSSKKGIWSKLNEGDILNKNDKSVIPLNIELKVPRENIYRHDIMNGNLKILNKKEEITNINIKVINSKYR